MLGRLEAGDRVIVRYSRSNFRVEICPGVPSTSNELDGEVLYTPTATGDMWTIKFSDGKTRCINPCCSELLWIEKITTEEK